MKLGLKNNIKRQDHFRVVKKNQEHLLKQVEVLLVFGRLLNCQQTNSVAFPLCPYSFSCALLMEASVKKSHEAIVNLYSTSHIFKKLVFPIFFF